MARVRSAKVRTWGAFTLGVADTTPLEMAGAYATVAADGKYCAPLPVISVTGSDGSAIKPAPACEQVISPDVARGALDAARCVTGYKGGDRRLPRRRHRSRRV